MLFNASDRRFMKIALGLADRSRGLSSPNPSVGCVIVRDRRIVGRGWHEYALMDHAEVRALREAGDRARNATAYVTLEPCCHYGRTGPCVNRLIGAGIRRIVVSRIDPNPKVAGRGIELLRSAGIQVDMGLGEEEAGRIIEPFACRIITGLPFVAAKVGMSLDGKIGTAKRTDRWITSPESREFGQGLRLAADALLVGVGTVLSDDPELTYRGSEGRTRPLARVILDCNLRTPAGARLLQTAPHTPVLIFCGAEPDRERRQKLENAGAEIIPVASEKDEVDPSAVLRELGRREMSMVLLEGGSEVHWSFISRGLVDKFYFIIAPLVLGGKNAVPSIGGAGYDVVAEAPRFRIRKSSCIGPDILLEAYPSFSKSIISPWLSREEAPSDGRG